MASPRGSVTIAATGRRPARGEARDAVALRDRGRERRTRRGTGGGLVAPRDARDADRASRPPPDPGARRGASRMAAAALADARQGVARAAAGSGGGGGARARARAAARADAARGGGARLAPRARRSGPRHGVSRAARARPGRAYFASWNSVDGTQPSLPSSSLTFQNRPSFSPLG